MHYTLTLPTVKHIYKSRQADAKVPKATMRAPKGDIVIPSAAEGFGMTKGAFGSWQCNPYNPCDFASAVDLNAASTCYNCSFYDYL
jgi:hypothetical protein